MAIKCSKERLLKGLSVFSQKHIFICILVKTSVSLNARRYNVIHRPTYLDISKLNAVSVTEYH